MRNNLSIKKEIQHQFEQLSEAAKSLDFDRYLASFDRENFTSLNADGTVYDSLDEFSESYRPQFEAIEIYHSLDFDKVHINVLNENLAILVNQFEADLELKSGDRFQAKGAGTQVWSKGSDGWKLVHVSSSSVP